MPKTLTFTLTDDQVTSLTQYVNSSPSTSWILNPVTGMNEPVRTFPTIESYLQSRFTDLLGPIMEAFPSVAVKTKLDAIKQLRDEISINMTITNMVVGKP